MKERTAALSDVQCMCQKKIEKGDENEIKAAGGLVTNTSFETRSQSVRCDTDKKERKPFLQKCGAYE